MFFEKITSFFEDGVRKAADRPEIIKEQGRIQTFPHSALFFTFLL